MVRPGGARSGIFILSGALWPSRPRAQDHREPVHGNVAEKRPSRLPFQGIHVARSRRQQHHSDPHRRQRGVGPGRADRHGDRPEQGWPESDQGPYRCRYGCLGRTSLHRGRADCGPFGCPSDRRPDEGIGFTNLRQQPGGRTAGRFVHLQGRCGQADDHRPILSQR
ncbi:hypothetical protein SDC9_143085 [bioreactor metagenome]|uniref:Uncharacterized protein n=1 Tax=bioreactor metagenome TaxID=1076179 RepID=A0A645E317_9ZZZZ